MEIFTRQFVLVIIIVATITIGVLCAGEVSPVFKEAYENIRQAISRGVVFAISPWQSSEQEETIGVVVMPLTDESEEIVEKIKNSFSDEVEIETRDENTGVITPIFREGKGEEYLYIIVPTAE